MQDTPRIVSKANEPYYTEQLARLIAATNNVSIIPVLPPEILTSVIDDLVALAIGDLPTLASAPELKESERDSAGRAVAAILHETRLHHSERNAS